MAGGSDKPLIAILIAAVGLAAAAVGCARKGPAPVAEPIAGDEAAAVVVPMVKPRPDLPPPGPLPATVKSLDGGGLKIEVPEEKEESVGTKDPLNSVEYGPYTHLQVYVCDNDDRDSCQPTPQKPFTTQPPFHELPPLPNLDEIEGTILAVGIRACRFEEGWVCSIWTETLHYHPRDFRGDLQQVLQKQFELRVAMIRECEGLRDALGIFVAHPRPDSAHAEVDTLAHNVLQTLDPETCAVLLAHKRLAGIEKEVAVATTRRQLPVQKVPTAPMAFLLLGGGMALFGVAVGVAGKLYLGQLEKQIGSLGSSHAIAVNPVGGADAVQPQPVQAAVSKHQKFFTKMAASMRFAEVAAGKNVSHSDTPLWERVQSAMSQGTAEDKALEMQKIFPKNSGVLQVDRPGLQAFYDFVVDFDHDVPPLRTVTDAVNEARARGLRLEFAEVLHEWIRLENLETYGGIGGKLGTFMKEGYLGFRSRGTKGLVELALALEGIEAAAAEEVQRALGKSEGRAEATGQLTAARRADLTAVHATLQKVTIAASLIPIVLGVVTMAISQHALATTPLQRLVAEIDRRIKRLRLLGARWRQARDEVQRLRAEGAPG